VDTIYGRIIADLKDAATLLPVNYITDSGFENDRTRVNQAAANALLARVYLYRGQWSQAEQLATTLINDPRYRLETNLDNVFLSTSKEAIWQLQPLYKKEATAEGNLFLPNGSNYPPVYELGSSLMASWEAPDQRRVHWTNMTQVNNGTWVYYACKYKQVAYGPNPPEYEMALRLAEQYLIRSEARLQQGNTIGATADLNVIRSRAGLSPTTAASSSDLQAAILHERQLELFSEWGHRWLDLKRTGQVDAVMSALRPGWKPMDALYPIPAREIQIDPKITQNPGY
jgi:hypothetical protein